ncbi:gas vesicle protein GvpN [Halalkalibacter alkaliphilus]|uniref:Gas vesicle protein GvpN n=1 Tax=Halalkalibacter alkaliphilus TaxID=2917993 RepID=A0A9X1ZY52_9BACI|nr:gas vesicle protein GvpN [Halalkalibacter alkaliphilus]MCL7745807.1 gas vesicle protein GvpN [Halalkalibacter alkaliphilus]
MKHLEDGKGTKIVLSPDLESIVNRATVYIQAGFPIHFIGPTGVGKTALAFYITKKLNRPYTFIQGNAELTNSDFLGGVTGFTKKKLIDNYIHTVYKSEEQEKEIWTEGPLLAACKKGHTFIYDEFNRSKPEINNILLPILQERQLPLYGVKTQEKMLPVHTNFSMIFTSNPTEYTGSFKAQDALLDRMITFRLHYYDVETEAQIISGNTGLGLEQAKRIAKVIHYTRSITTETHAPSLRSAIMIATIAKRGGIKVDFSDDDFLILCTDVLFTPSIGSRSNKSEDDIQKLIIKEIRGWSGEK